MTFPYVGQLDSTRLHQESSAQSANQQTPLASSPFSLTNAAEELSFGREEDIKKRSIVERSLAEYEPPVVPELQEIDAYLDAMHDQDASANLQTRAQDLITAANRRENPLSLLRRWSREPSKQYLTLAYSLQTARAGGAAPQVLNTLSDAVDSLVASDGAAIYADLNTVYQAQLYGEGQQEGDVFRSTYRDAIMGCQHLNDTLLLLLERFENNFTHGIAVMREALAQDLASVRPSIEPERLNLLLQDLYQLGVMAGVMAHCQRLVWQLRAYRLSLRQPVPLLKDLVRWAAEPLIFGFHVSELVEKYCRARDDSQGDQGGEDEQDDADDHGHGEDDEAAELAKQVPKEVAERAANPPVREDASESAMPQDNQPADALLLQAQADQDPREIFLMGTMDVLRAMPPKVFITDEHRFEAIVAVQQALDKLTGVEVGE
jgi:type III secretion protein W